MPPKESCHPSAAIAKGQGDITNQGVSLVKKRLKTNRKQRTSSKPSAGQTPFAVIAESQEESANKDVRHVR